MLHNQGPKFVQCCMQENGGSGAGGYPRSQGIIIFGRPHGLRGGGLVPQERGTAAVG